MDLYVRVSNVVAKTMYEKVRPHLRYFRKDIKDMPKGMGRDMTLASGPPPGRLLGLPQEKNTGERSLLC